MIRPALIAALLLAGPAFAQTPASGAERLAPAFGKTVVSTYPDGRTAKLWLKADGTYQGQGRRGGPSAGRWTVKGDRVCFRQQRPTSIPFSHCAPLPAADSGASWTGKAATGERIRLQIVPGGPPASPAAR